MSYAIRKSNLCENSMNIWDFKTKFNVLLNNQNPTLTLKIYTTLDSDSTDELIF